MLLPETLFSTNWVTCRRVYSTRYRRLYFCMDFFLYMIANYYYYLSSHLWVKSTVAFALIGYSYKLIPDTLIKTNWVACRRVYSTHYRRYKNCIICYLWIWWLIIIIDHNICELSLLNPCAQVYSSMVLSEAYTITNWVACRRVYSTLYHRYYICIDYSLICRWL